MMIYKFMLLLLPLITIGSGDKESTKVTLTKYKAADCKDADKLPDPTTITVGEKTGDDLYTCEDTKTVHLDTKGSAVGSYEKNKCLESADKKTWFMYTWKDDCFDANEKKDEKKEVKPIKVTVSTWTELECKGTEKSTEITITPGQKTDEILYTCKDTKTLHVEGQDPSDYENDKCVDIPDKKDPKTGTSVTYKWSGDCIPVENSDEEDKSKLTAGQIVGIVFGSLAFAGAIGCTIYYAMTN